MESIYEVILIRSYGFAYYILDSSFIFKSQRFLYLFLELQFL